MLFGNERTHSLADFIHDAENRDTYLDSSMDDPVSLVTTIAMASGTLHPTGKQGVSATKGHAQLIPRSQRIGGITLSCVAST